MREGYRSKFIILIDDFKFQNEKSQIPIVVLEFGISSYLKNKVIVI